MKSYDRYFKDLRVGFFDIETTGLNRDKDHLILSGLAVPDGDKLIAKQYLAESISNEAEVLSQTLSDFKELDFVVTYNGDSFDIPFLKTRCEKLGIPVTDEIPYNLDLYKVVKLSPLRGMLPNLKQTTIENYLGLWKSRTDEITGKESISLYYSYASSGDEAARDKVLLHNHDDICQLSRLLPVLQRTDLDKALFTLGFPAGNDTINDIKLKHNRIDCLGLQGGDRVEYRLYDDFNSGTYMEADADKGTFRMQVPVISEEKFTVADLRSLGIDSSIFPETTDDFLILKENGRLRYDNINGLLAAMLDILMNKART